MLVFMGSMFCAIKKKGALPSLFMDVNKEWKERTKNPQSPAVGKYNLK